MKTLLSCLALTISLSASCATHGAFFLGNRHGDRVSYGELRHPGIDFIISIDTPVIAVADGKVITIAEPDADQRYGGGFYVRISHGENFDSVYTHLRKFAVVGGQSVRRGQLIGLSGADNGGYAHLHFGICHIGGLCKNYSQTYNPDELWLGGKPQCFDPNREYSTYSQREITLPVACGDYAGVLKSRLGDMRP